jgi:transposase
LLAERAPATVVMEACGTAHFWGREAEARGHRVLLLLPHAVRPYVPRNKTDGADAQGLLEAVRNEELHPVPVKSVDQHSARRPASDALGLAGDTYRTAEHRTGAPARARVLDPARRPPGGSPRVGARLRCGLRAPDALHPVLVEAAREIAELEARIRAVERSLETLAGASPVLVRLRTIPGVGLLTATALVAFVGDVRRFPSGRHLASYLGLTPRETSSGLERRRGRISKRGDPYLRMLLLHGARSVLCHAKKATRAGPSARLGAGARAAARAQQGGRGVGQQARAHRLGGVAPRTTLWRTHPGGGAMSQPPTNGCFEHTT